MKTSLDIGYYESQSDTTLCRLLFCWVERVRTVVWLSDSFPHPDYFPSYVKRESKEKLSLGIARDAYTFKWKDIKDRIVDDMSETTHVEKLRIPRDRITEDEFGGLH